MASSPQNLDFVLEQLTLDGVTSRKMFGEYALYYRERTVALFCDDQLFIKPTNAGRAFIGKVSEGAPYPGAKPWFFISGDRCEDGEWLSELVRVTASEVPLPKPKPRKLRTAAKGAKLARSPKKTGPGRASPAPKKAARKSSPRVGKAGGVGKGGGVGVVGGVGKGGGVGRKKSAKASPKRRA